MKIGFGGIALCGIVLVMLPAQIWVLAKEGFPAPVWPAPGSFEQIIGEPKPVKLDPLVVTAQARERFIKSGGRALLVSRGAQNFEYYGSEIGPETRLNSYSLVKSLIGVLVLRAVAEGRISGLDEHLPNIIGPNAPDISVRDVLTMTSGLSLAFEPPKDDKSASLDDAKFSPFSPVAKLHAFGIKAVLDRLRIEPSVRGNFHYQSANTALLALVVEQAFDQPINEVLERLIWRPAGADKAYWRKVSANSSENAAISAHCCLYARAQDWLRVGRFLMQNGSGTNPFLPPALWQQWIKPDLDADLRMVGVYGWHIRHDVLDRDGAALQGPFAYMSGHGGQKVYLLPEQDVVVVRFGETSSLLHSTLYELFPDG